MSIASSPVHLRPPRRFRWNRYDGSQEPDDATEDYYYPEDAYYYVKTADDLE